MALLKEGDGKHNEDPYSLVKLCFGKAIFVFYLLHVLQDMSLNPAHAGFFLSLSDKIWGLVVGYLQCAIGKNSYLSAEV